MTARGLRRGNWSVQELERLRLLLPQRGVEGTAALLRRSPESVRKRATKLWKGSLRRGEWTDEDEAVLRRAWGAVDPRLLGVILGRPAADVSRRAAALRAARRTGSWSHADLQALKRLYGTRSGSDLEVCLQRSVTDIETQASRMCLRKDKRFAKQQRRSGGSTTAPRWTPAEVQRLRTTYADRENIVVARLLGRSVASVANKAWQLGLQKSAAVLERIGRTNVAVRFRELG